MIQTKQANGSVYDAFPALKIFKQNICARHPEYGSAIPKNLYLIQSIDMDGNVTEEHYGLNLITDMGIDEIMWNPTNERYQLTLYEGASAAADLLDYTEPTYTRKINHTDSNGSYIAYPMTYDSVTGVISQTEQWMQFTFDYNYTGIESDMTINCITYNPITDNGGMQYRPILKITTYDANGMEAPITKHINEKLVITMFAIGTIHEDLLIDGYANGNYIAINPVRMLRTRVGGNSYSCQIRALSAIWETYSISASGNTYTYWNIDTLTNGQKYLNMHGEQDYWAKCTMSWVMSDPRVYMSRVEFRLGNYWSYGYSDDKVISWWTEDKLTQPEEITCDSVFTDSFDSPNLGNSFGMKKFDTTTCYGIIPAADFSISAVKGYNYTTKAWDIDIPFIDAPYAYYDNPFIVGHLDVGVGTDWSNYVYIHPRAKDSTGRPSVALAGLKKPTSGSAYTMYATDKYWDRSTWELIPNMSNIPSSLQKKKYYISVGGSNDDVIPTFDQTVHALNVGTSHTVQNAPTDFIKKGPYGFRSIVDLTNGWILAQEHLLFMNGNDVQYAYKLTGPDFYKIYNNRGEDWSSNYDKYYIYQNDAYVLNTNPTYDNSKTYYTNAIDPYTIRYGFGNKILVATTASEPSKTYPTAVRLYTITSPSTAPTYQDIQIDTNTTDRTYSGLYSVSENGYFVIQDPNTHCANIISIDDGSVVKLEDVEYCFAINYTNYCVYMISNSTSITFNVYDMSTNTVYASFVLPDAYSNITFIMGWNGYFYIKSRSGSTDYVHMYNIHDGSLSLLDSSFTIPNTFLTTRVTSNYTHEYYNRVNQVSGLLFDPDVMVISPPAGQSSSAESSNYSPYRYIKIDSPDTVREAYKHGSYSERPIESYFETNTYDGSGGAGRVSTSLVRAVQSVSQSRLLLIDTLSSPRRNDSGDACDIIDTNNYWASVLDFGIVVGTEEMQNTCYKHNTTSDSSYWHGGLIYWNNGIIRMTDTEATWRPLDWFLPHKVTGTTYTIQAYNNPKKIGGKEFIYFKTNRGPTYQHTDPPRSSGDLQMVFKHGTTGYSGGTENGFWYMKRIHGEVLGSYPCDVSVPSGTTVRVEVEPVEGFEFLVGTFKWYLKGFTITVTDNNQNVTTNWTSSVATADDKNQTNGTSIITSADANTIGVVIASSSSTIPWLTPTMIKSIKITTDPHIST